MQGKYYPTSHQASVFTMPGSMDSGAPVSMRWRPVSAHGCLYAFGLSPMPNPAAKPKHSMAAGNSSAVTSLQRWSSDDRQPWAQRHSGGDASRLGADLLGPRRMSYDQAGGLDRRISSHASYQSEVGSLVSPASCLPASFGSYWCPKGDYTVRASSNVVLAPFSSSRHTNALSSSLQRSSEYISGLRHHSLAHGQQSMCDHHSG